MGLFDSGGATTTTQTSLPPWLQQYAEWYLGESANQYGQPWQGYDRQRVADLSPLQRQGIQGLGDLAGGTDSMHAADGMLQQTLQGGYQNPYAGRGVDYGGQYAFNPVQGGSNPYAGTQNPYFQDSLRGTLGDVTDAYERGTAADTKSAFALAGSFGGLAHQNAVANNQRELGRTLGNVTNQAYQQQYDRSTGLAESALGRGQRAGEFNATLGNQSFDSAANRYLRAGMFGQEQGSQSWENERNRQMNAVGAASGLAGQYGQSYRDSIMGGSLEQQQQQRLLDTDYGDWQSWLNYPQTQLNNFGNALGSLSGRASVQTNTGPGPDRFAQGLGLMQLFGGSGGGNWLTGLFGGNSVDPNYSGYENVFYN